MKLCGMLQCRHELKLHGDEGCTVEDCTCEAFGDFEPVYHRRGGKSVEAVFKAVGAALAGKTVLLVTGAGSVRIEPVKLKEQLHDIRIDEMIVNDGANGSESTTTSESETKA